MATLTEISVYTRKAIIWVAAAIVAYLLLRFLVILGINYYKATHPAKVPPPNVLFGKIPVPKFPQNASSSAGLKFFLENIEGKPPETTPSGKVYFMPKKLPSLLAPQKARNFATNLGFTTDPQVLNATFYRFIDQQDNLRSLDIDIVNDNFQINYDYTKVISLFSPGSFSSTQGLITDLNNYLQNNRLFDSSLFNNYEKVSMLTYNFNTQQFNSVSRIVDADAARVDFFRTDLDGLKLLPPQFNQSYIYVIVSTSSDPNKKYVKIAYTFWPIAFDNFATYPLRASQQAWNDLLGGKGIIANLGSNSAANQIVVRNIYLAYYDSGETESYLEPIFVFEGDNNFVAYVPAIEGSWLE